MTTEPIWAESDVSLSMICEGRLTIQEAHPQIPKRPSFSSRRKDARIALGKISSSVLEENSDVPDDDAHCAERGNEDSRSESIGGEVGDCGVNQIRRSPHVCALLTFADSH